MGFEIINALKKEQGLTNAQIAKMSGITLSTLDKITSGVNTNPKLDTLQAICKVLGCTLDDFADPAIRAKKAPSISDEAIRLAKDYDNLDGYGRRMVRLVADEENARCTEQAREQPNAWSSPEITGTIIDLDKTIPFLRSLQSASAGTGIFLGPEEFETIYVHKNDLTRRASFCVPVSGDSMEPDYHNGDVLLVERAEDIKIGEVGVFTINGEGYVKERGDMELISLNPVYAPIPMNESIRCNGRVIGTLDPEWIVEK